MKKQIGAFIGKFYPPHIGHLWVVDNCAKQLDEVWIIISKNNNRNINIFKTNSFDVLDANLIKIWFEQHYKNNPKIKVAVFDETNLKPYPQDQDAWVQMFKREFPQINVKIADESYRKFNEKYFPECKFFAIERDVVPIHSTNLRENIYKYFDYLIPEAKDFFKNKEKKI